MDTREASRSIAIESFDRTQCRLLERLERLERSEAVEGLELATEKVSAASLVFYSDRFNAKNLWLSL